MESTLLPLRILFIPSVARTFPCSRKAELGEKNASSLLIRRLIRSTLYHWPGPASPFLIPFWLLPQGEPCFVLKIENRSTRYSRLTRRRITKMTQQVTAHHLSRLAYLYVRQSTLQQVLANMRSANGRWRLAGARSVLS